MAEFDDFFDDLFGQEETVVEAKPEKKTKASEKKEGKGKPKAVKAAKPATTFKTPIKVKTGYMPDFTLGADAFGNKEDGITEAELKAAIEKQFPYYTGIGASLNRKSETEVEIYLKAIYTQNKGVVKISDKSTAFLAGTRIPLTNFLKEAEGTEIPVETLEKELIKAIRCKVIVTDDVIAVLPGSRVLPPTERVGLPTTINVLTKSRSEVILTEADFRNELPAKEEMPDEPSEDEDDDEDEGADDAPSAETETSVVTDGTVAVKDIVAELERRFPSFGGGLKLCACVEDDKVVGYTVRYAPEAVSTVKAPKETTYPSEGLTISLLFKRYKVAASDFGGKAEVTVKDIAAYLRSQGEFDYEDDKTSVSNYNKETATVVVSFRGGTKG